MAPPPRTISLDGVIYPIDIRKFRAQTQEGLRAGVATSEAPSDALLNPEGAWSRYRYSWDHGAGQIFDDMREESHTYRFDTSDGVEVFTEGQLTLLPACVSQTTWATATPKLKEAATYLYLSAGTALTRIDNTGTRVVCGAPGGSITDLASDGTDLYVSSTIAVVKYVNGATAATAFTVPIGGNNTAVGFVSGHLLFAQSNVLYEAAADGTPTLIKTHFQPGFRWNVFFAVGSRIYAGGYANGHTELYTIAVASGGALVLGAEVAPFPAGEVVLSAEAHAGIVIFGTTKGARIGQVGTDGTITYGPLLGREGYVYDIATEGRFAYATTQNASFPTQLSHRIALDTFTDTLQPAWASDVIAPASGQAWAIARFAGSTWVATDTTLYRTSLTAFQTTGSVTSGRIYFGSVEPKYLVGLMVRFPPLVNGNGVTLQVFNEAGQSVSANTTTIGATSIEIVTDLGTLGVFATTRFYYATVKVTLTTSVTTSPVLRQWRARAYPVVPPVRQWWVPLHLVSNAVIGQGGGQAYPQDVETLHANLAFLHEVRAPVEFVMGSVTEMVRVDAYDFEAEKWTDDGAWLQGTMMVRLVAVQQ